MNGIKQCQIALRARKFFCACFACILFLNMAAPSLAADRQKVRVGYLQMENFQEGGPGEVKSGYGYEYLQMLRSYTGWEYEYVYADWDELLKMLERGEIDLMSHVPQTKNLENKVLFALESQNQEPQYLYVLADNWEVFGTDLSTLNQKTVGILAGESRRLAFDSWCRERNYYCRVVEYSSAERMHKDLEKGILDCVIESRMATTSHREEWKYIANFGTEPVYFAVNKNRPDLLAQVNEAQAQILAIHEFYGEQLQSRYQKASIDSVPVLTESQQQRIENSGVLKVGYCERRPLAFTDKVTGELSGLLSDYLNVISEAYGLQFEAVPCSDGYDMRDALMEGRVDIIAPVGYHYGMAENQGMAITDPISVEAMLAVYKGYRAVVTRDIFGRIAVLKKSLSERDYIQRFYPEAEIVEADCVDDALEMVHRGKADCYIMRASYWSWGKNEFPLLNILEVLNLTNTNNVNMAVRSENMDLIPILNKGISLMSESERTRSMVAYSDARQEVTFGDLLQENPVTFGLAFLALVLLFICTVIGYRLLIDSSYMRKLRTAKDEADQARIYAEASRAEAERANRAKSTFMTSISHDIRTPMNAIIGMTTLASQHLDDQEYIRSCLNKVALASNHLLTLINDVLDINKIETGNLSLNPTVFSLADSIMNMANISRPLIREKKHTFEVRIHHLTEEYVFADELRISQIFINLLSNAIKYTPAGGMVTVDVMQEPIPDCTDRVRLIYIVQDNGIGMDEAFQSHMYELFTMASKHSSSASGSGVGLSICKQLVDLMEGTIVCESAKGNGTKFTVTLELTVADKALEYQMLPPMNVLLVDDDEIFRFTASHTLRELGLTADLAANGEEAVRMAAEKHSRNSDYPLILIDYQMPGMNGLETTRAIRDLVGPEASIIVVSAYDPDEVEQAAMEAGANGFLCKPFFRSGVYQDLIRILGQDQTPEKTEQMPDNAFRGMKLLVAEDNDMNWEIARGLLSMYNIQAVRAADGQVCVELMEAAPEGEYEMILMDIQMPVMNGYEAAQAIRSSQRSYVRSIPIIAMTADAFTEDVIRCKAYGMNAHVAKPIVMEKLLDTMLEIRNSSVLDIYQ